MPAKAGDLCESCKPRWEHTNKPPVKLVKLPSGFVVCPYCDGGAIVDIAQKAKKRKKNDSGSK